MYICKNCKKSYEVKPEKIAGNFCSKSCKIEYERQKRLKKSREEFKDKPHCECKICGFMGVSLTSHIKMTHNISINDYINKFNCSLDDVVLKSSRESNAAKQRENYKNGKNKGFTSENNPSKGKDCKEGRNSPFSMNFRGYDGLTEKEKIEKIEEITRISKENLNKRGNNPLSLDYYLKRGMNLNEAKEALHDRQSTFSLKKCIAKYGEEEGLKRWQERQTKWQASLAKLPEEEKERIIRAKMSGCRGYSLISQKLFWDIYPSIKSDFKEIYFATLKDGEYFEADHAYHNEYYVSSDNQHFFLDFLIKDTMKVIEFDGDYWHSEKADKNKLKKDAERERVLTNLGYKIFHVKEHDYRTNPDKIIEDVLNFIYH